MSNKMFNKIKRKKGETFAKTIRDYHNGILEIPNLHEIVEHAGNNAEPILQYLITVLLSEKEESAQVTKTPIELLNDAGYDAVDCTKAPEKALPFKQYYAKGEVICTFNDLESRCKNYNVIFAKKKNVDEIKRENFTNPERDDEYGTSVISIQFVNNYISIKNRYNHKVSNCDNTFNSNPDNIIEGLTQSICKHYNVQFKNCSNVPEGWVLFGEQLVKQNYEINGVVYGDNCYIRNGELVVLEHNEILLDYFIYDKNTSIVRKVDNSINDCFDEAFNSVLQGKTYHKGNTILCKETDQVLVEFK